MSVRINTSTILAYIKRRKILTACLVVAILLYAFCLPNPLFRQPVSTVLEDRHGQLLGAKIAADGQWRFPEMDELPEKYITALTSYEDKRFFYHPGFDPLSIIRAIRQNLASGKKVSGASTITMQTIRLARGRKRRNIPEKIYEIILATRLEWRYSKQKILKLYAANAPFGGNVVGLETACWRYFGKNMHDLSWAEACMLAILPNNPGSIFPGKNRQTLLLKRNKLLKKLYELNKIDKTTYELSTEEILPDAPTTLPRWTPQLVEKFAKQTQQNEQRKKIHTTIDLELQKKVNDIARRHTELLRINDIQNLAILIIDNKSNEVLSYTGNAPDAGINNQGDVDIITASRSTGSLLKPLLYAKAMDRGLVLPHSLLPDIPVQFGAYKPENFRLTYDGTLPVNLALAKSLNVPFVKLLESYGIQVFHNDLKKFGFTGLNPSASHYGLTMVVGGIENSLWNVCKCYAGMSRVLSDFRKNNGKYSLHAFDEPSIVGHEPIPKGEKLSKYAPVVKAASVWHTFEAMQGLERPNESGDWEKFVSSRKIAWKTGTSFGYRDAWAVGVSPRYTVGVWAGNATGEGRPNLIGIYTAAPLLFEIFDQLPDAPWFEEPYDDEVKIPVCRTSGYRASAYCPADSVFVPSAGIHSAVCSYHEQIYTDLRGEYRVNMDCETGAGMVAKSWFVLKPIEEYYFRQKNSWYEPLPPYKEGCNPSIRGRELINIIYPRDESVVFLPRQMSGEKGQVILEAAHQRSDAAINWFIDEQFMATTHQKHKINVSPTPGQHLLVLVDDKGYRLVIRFEAKDSESKR